MMKNPVLLFMVLTLSSCAFFYPNPNRKLPTSQTVLELRPFTTDYCSVWPNGKWENRTQWSECCFAHDMHYWIGGSEEEKKHADLGFKECIKEKSDGFNAFLMYTGVRMGGNPSEASYAWDYGWTQDRKFFVLRPEEIQTAKTLLETSPYNEKESERRIIRDFIDHFLMKKP